MTKWERFLFEWSVVVTIGLLGFMALSIYNMRVIDQQRTEIRRLLKTCH